MIRSVATIGTKWTGTAIYNGTSIICSTKGSAGTIIVGGTRNEGIGGCNEDKKQANQHSFSSSSSLSMREE